MKSNTNCNENKIDNHVKKVYVLKKEMTQESLPREFFIPPLQILFNSKKPKTYYNREPLLLKFPKNPPLPYRESLLILSQIPEASTQNQT